MQVHYLEIVTPDVDAACALHAQLHGTEFGPADPGLGGARTAELSSGGLVGIRAPLRDTEEPVVRPYLQVADIAAAVEAATRQEEPVVRPYLQVADIAAAVEAATRQGAQIAVPPMALPGHGHCAIIIHNGIESGLWER